ncbi:hypothetical protein A6A20_09500 [Volucribacter amazonae]|uniref:Regulator of competence-specific genes n=2 Tax=Volucribacter amazonae TaxID=256731 RepID=A0A9X4PCW3_9PAST|nr:hypothetical protein [Volucribacter amazonae]
MFSICKSGVFYLRAENELAIYLESLGAVKWINDSPGLAISKYYRLPNSIMNDLQLYRKVVIASIQQVKLQKLADELDKKQRIKEMANLTIKHERLLAKVEIHNVKEFLAVGPQNSYVRLKKAGFTVNINIFWLFIAALKNKHVSLLTKNERKQALSVLNISLTNAGLKPVKEES